MSSMVGPLLPPDENDLQLPEGFTSRIVARSGTKPIPDSDYVWHAAPDGGATFSTANEGWIYVSNSEMPNGGGGVGALRFDNEGALMDAYSILDGTNRNCAGGPTPWATWMSCEEVARGLVWECDPQGENEAMACPALGIFRHEAAAVDLKNRHVFLTEDERDGCFYRFTANRVSNDSMDLSSGILEVARVIGESEGRVIWRELPDPAAKNLPTRRQVPQSTSFKGGEGIWFHDGIIYFATKHDNRIWTYDTEEEFITIFYDDDFFVNAILTGVDNITVSKGGVVFVAEDGGDMQIVMIDRFRQVTPIIRIAGHPDSEVTGPSFDPSGSRLYFSSQRGRNGHSDDGVTYEVKGPFGRFEILGSVL